MVSGRCHHFPPPLPPSPSWWLPLPLPLLTEGAGGWAPTLSCPVQCLHRALGLWQQQEEVVVACGGRRAVLTGDHLPGCSSACLGPSLPPFFPGWHHYPPLTPPPWALPASPRKPPHLPRLSLPSPNCILLLLLLSPLLLGPLTRSSLGCLFPSLSLASSHPLSTLPS